MSDHDTRASNCTNDLKSPLPSPTSTTSSCRERTAKFRAIRRSLQDITPENSLPQLQSPLFSLLPAEIRISIFSYVLCQYHDSPQNLRGHYSRPGHTHNTAISTSLLRTCRLVYYEAHAIPLRSATHHIIHDPSQSFNPSDWDHYFYHISSQSGKDLYHLHTTKASTSFSFTTFLIPHLHWRKLTWTLCASEWWCIEAMYDQYHLADRISAVRFPSSCREINLEYESLVKLPQQRKILRKCADECRAIKLTRRDGTVLEVDDVYSCEYTWEGETWVPARTGLGDDDWDGQHGEYVKALYHVIRVCWRENVSEREYASWDRLNCLRPEGIVKWTEEEIEKDKQVVAKESPEEIETSGEWFLQ